MYPNPQDALPLPSRPSVEQYKKLAKDLVKSCRSGDPAAIGVWASRWIQALAAHQREPDALRDGTEINARANQIDQFARTKLLRWRRLLFEVRARRRAVCDRAGAWLPELAEIREAHRVTCPRELTRFRIRSRGVCHCHGRRHHAHASAARASRIDPGALDARASRHAPALCRGQRRRELPAGHVRRTSRRSRRSCSRRAPKSTARRTSTEVDVRLSGSSPRVLLPRLPACSGM